jgi:ubiquinone/menaquinone biosynthesis C-methylase UbiE
VDSTFRIEQALDFGCGVGRILIPLCKRALFVTGVDVSTGMLNEARKNCQAFAANNVELIHYNGSSLGVSGKFNFIHSFIVFQHIPKRRGTYLFVDLINHLEENGVGVIHFTYYRKATRVFRILYRLINKSSFLSGLWNIIRGQPASSPVLQMNMYDLNDLFRILQDQNCHNIHVRFTKHNEIFYGALIFFQKKSNIISGIG